MSETTTVATPDYSTLARAVVAAVEQLNAALRTAGRAGIVVDLGLLTPAQMTRDGLSHDNAPEVIVSNISKRFHP